MTYLLTVAAIIGLVEWGYPFCDVCDKRSRRGSGCWSCARKARVKE